MKVHEMSFFRKIVVGLMRILYPLSILAPIAVNEHFLWSFFTVRNENSVNFM